MGMQDRDQLYMRRALELAEQAAAEKEVPVGAVIVKDNQIISEGYNLREQSQSALAHAEIAVIESACQKLNSWRLVDCELFVTLEPCVMCAGAIVQSRLSRVVFGATDPKAGAVETLYQICSDERLNHRCEVVGGVLADEASQQLSDFFKGLRKK